MTDHNTTVDKDQIQNFLTKVSEHARHAFRGIENPGVLQLSQLHPTSDRLGVLGRFRLDDVKGMTDAAYDAAQAGHNIYIEPRTVRNDLSNKERGGSNDTRGVFALVVDADAYKGKAVTAALPPTLSVASGGENSRHDWYFLARALPDEKAREIGVGLRVAGGDANTGNPSQPYRVAGTPNFPNRKKREELKRETAATSIISADGARYTPEELAAAYPPPASRQVEGMDDRPARPLEELLAELPDGREKDLSETPQEDDRSGHYFKVTGWLKGDGYTQEEVVALWEAHPTGAASKYADRPGGIAAQVANDWPALKDKPRSKRRSNGDVVTEDGVSMEFVERFTGKLKFDHDAGRWHEFVGTHWKLDKSAKAFDYVRLLARELGQDADRAKRLTLGKRAFAGGVESFARGDRAFAVTSEHWDPDPFLLGTPGGTVDLRTGKMREADPADAITKITSVAPAETADCPMWKRFMDETTGGDEGLMRFVQQYVGYALTGDIREHAIFFIYGPGGNGKSVFLNTIRTVLGDYATVASMDTFTASRNEQHPADMAMLRGARLVSVSEVEQGKAWAEKRINQLTGGDPISARFMRQDFFTYQPAFKLIIIGNHKPILNNVNDAARRRFHILPFERKPENPDRELETKLREEGPAILRWAIDGCLDWQANGLVKPDIVQKTTDEYFAAQDVLGQWLNESCAFGEHNIEKFKDLFRSWNEYAELTGERSWNSRRFSDALTERGFPPEKGTGNVSIRRGLMLKHAYDERNPPPPTDAF